MFLKCLAIYPLMLPTFYTDDNGTFCTRSENNGIHLLFIGFNYSGAQTLVIWPYEIMLWPQ